MSASRRNRSCNHILHVQLEDLVTVLACRLCMVHGDVSVTEQRLGAGGRVGERHSDAWPQTPDFNGM